MEDFRREFKQEALKMLTPEERLEGLSPEEIENYLRRLKDQSPANSPRLE
jgi:hypothetical protein